MIEKRLVGSMKLTGYKLESMHGIEVVSAAGFVAEIGNINRFSSPEKLARFSGGCLVLKASGDKFRLAKCKKGNRVLHDLFFRLACRQTGVARGSKQSNNPYYYEHYQHKMATGKTKT